MRPWAVFLLASLRFGSPAPAADENSQLDLTLGGAAPLPANGTAAAGSAPLRQRAVTAFLACGQELDFLKRIRSTGKEKSTAETINLALAKMHWYAGMPDVNGKAQFPEARTTCHQEMVFTPGMLPADETAGPPFDPAPVRYAASLDGMARLPALDGRLLNAVMVRLFGQACSGVIAKVASAAGKYTVTFEVTPACLRAQANKALGQVAVTGQMGTGAGMPCHVFKSLTDDEGNWDFSMRSLIRALYIDRLYARRHPVMRLYPPILDPEVRRHIREDLILTEIGLGPPDYPITGCGNTEHASGDAADRVDDGGFFEDAGDALGDILDWLLKHWYLSYPALAPLLAGADPIVVAAVQAAAAANVLIQETRIPETENHRLMIESTRYLNNQLLQADLAARGDSGRLDSLNSAQRDVHDWLLQRMQSILRDDFSEYNSRPYQRESIGALMNLYDFAEDSEVSTAARLVLEYAFAKFAVGSNQGRRLPPYRRHMEAIVDPLEKGESVLYPGKEADHQVGLGLLYAGQTQQLDGGKAGNIVAPEIAFGALSGYLPNKLVIDLAIDKSAPYYQRFRHGGVEVYSSGKGFLITAGGLRTGYASTVLGLGDANDMGTAVPTTIMFPSGINKATLPGFLRLSGQRVKVQGSWPPSDPQITYDHNACVARGFACGINITVPADINACLKPGPASREPFWFFFNSKTCPGYEAGPPVYMVLYRRPCGAAAEQCRDFGFLEAMDSPGADSPAAFGAFLDGVLKRNPPGLIPQPPAMVAGGGGLAAAVPLPSTYFTTDGRKIEFDVTEHILDRDRTGLKTVAGAAEKKWTEWPLAQGDLIDKNDWPLVTIKNPRFPGQAVTLDFRGWGVPKYDGP